MKSFKLLLSFCLLQTPVTVQAQSKVWLRAYDSPIEDFLVFLQSSSRVSYAEFQLQYFRKKAQKFRLKEKLLSAQKLYLDAKKQKAMKFFNEITKEAYSADWSSEERRIITYAFLRSAQIQEEEEKTQAFLTLARNFYGENISKETYSDFELFPPPLMRQLEELQKTNTFVIPDWERIFPQHEILLINGQRIDKAQQKKFLAVSYRVTVLSSSHRAWSKSIHLSKLLLKPVVTARLTSGFCEKIVLIPELKKDKKFQLFSIPKCQSSEKLLLTEQPVDSKKMEQDTELSQKVNVSLEEFLEREDMEKEEPSKENTNSYLMTWIIAGVGLIAVVLLASLGTKNSKEKEKKKTFIY